MSWFKYRNLSVIVNCNNKHLYCDDYPHFFINFICLVFSSMVWQLTNQDGYVTHNVLQISTTGQLDFWCTWGQIGFWNWTNLDFGYLLLLCSYFKSTTKHLVSAKIMLLVSEGVVISPPLSSLTLFGGDITPFLEHYGEGGGFPPRGWYPPLVLIWPWATGV